MLSPEENFRSHVLSSRSRYDPLPPLRADHKEANGSNEPGSDEHSQVVHLVDIKLCVFVILDLGVFKLFIETKEAFEFTCEWTLLNSMEC